ncbi:hypothetical protein [Alicyclobacillus fodiniaquatilis]|uniref:Conjugative transposon protein TcpC n=1 Tax=Alicyclobacillus fodiniaquatilis TaxID=1661150 RepID=A0ABW4JGS6_9BACL
MNHDDRVTELYPVPPKDRERIVLQVLKGFIVWFFRNLMAQPKMRQLYEARRSPVILLLGFACFGLIMSGIYHEVRHLFMSPSHKTKSEQHHANPAVSVSALKEPEGTVSSTLTKQISPKTSVPAFHLRPPKFIVEPGPKGLKAPSEVEQVASRFAWLDNLSGAQASGPAILAQLRQMTTPNLYGQLASGFSPPKTKQTWMDIKVYLVRVESDGSWWVNTIAEAKNSAGQVQQLRLFDNLVKEGTTWKVQRVAFVPPTD